MSVSKNTILNDLEDFCIKYKTFALAAAALKITSAQLSTTRAGKSAVIPDRILKKLGYRREMIYTPTARNAEKIVKATGTHKISRSSVTGRTVTPEFAKANPTTTERQTVRNAGKRAPDEEVLNVFEK